MTEPVEYDPVFESVAKMLYGEDCDLGQVSKSLLGNVKEKASDRDFQLKALATGATVAGMASGVRGLQTEGPEAVRGFRAAEGARAKVKAVRGASLHAANLGGEVAVLSALHHHSMKDEAAQTAPPGVVRKDAPSGSDMYVPGTSGNPDREKMLRLTRRLKRKDTSVAKAYFDMIDAAVEVGAITPEGDWGPVMKSMTDHLGRLHGDDGKFQSKGTAHAKTTGRIARDIAIAGGLGVTAAMLGSHVGPRSTEMAEHMGEVARLLRSRNAAERAQGLAKLPSAAKVGGKAVLTAGGAATAGIGATASGRDAYSNAHAYNISVEAQRAADEAKKKAKSVARSVAKHLTDDPIHEAEHLAAGTHPTQIRAKITTPQIGERASARLNSRSRMLRRIAEIGSKVEATGSTGLKVVGKREYTRDKDGKFASTGSAAAAASGATAAGMANVGARQMEFEAEDFSRAAEHERRSAEAHRQAGMDVLDRMHNFARDSSRTRSSFEHEGITPVRFGNHVEQVARMHDNNAKMLGQAAWRARGNLRALKLTEAGGLGLATAGLAGLGYEEMKRRESVGKYYSEEREATPGELAQARHEHPIASRLRRKKYSYGTTAADDDGNKVTDVGVHPGESGVPGKVVSHFSDDALGHAEIAPGVPKRVRKSDEDEYDEVVWAGEFSKVDDEHRNVFGWASVVEKNGEPVVDLQGDYVEPAEIEKAAYHYVLNSRIGGDMHRRSEDGDGVQKSRPLHVSDLIESFMVTPEKVAKMGLPPGSLPTGWWVGFHVNDDKTWQEVKKGNRRGFSIHGVGVRKEAPIEEVDPRYALLSKAYDESEDAEEYAVNLSRIAEVTEDSIMKALAMNTSRRIQQTNQIAQVHTEAMQQATQMLAPQVAQEIQRIQQEQMLQMQQAQAQAPQTQGQGTWTQGGMQQGPQTYATGDAQVQQGPAQYA